MVIGRKRQLAKRTRNQRQDPHLKHFKHVQTSLSTATCWENFARQRNAERCDDGEQSTKHCCLVSISISIDFFKWI